MTGRGALVALSILALAGGALGPAKAEAQGACSASALRPLSAAITARDLRLPRPGARADRCTRVAVLGPELGPAVVAHLDGARCALVAVAYRRTVVRTETCGYDVHYEPAVETGVAVLARAGRGWRRVALGALPMERLDGLSTREAEGRGSLTLDGRALAIVRRRVVLAP